MNLCPVMISFYYRVFMTCLYIVYLFAIHVEVMGVSFKLLVSSDFWLLAGIL